MSSNVFRFSRSACRASPVFRVKVLEPKRPPMRWVSSVAAMAGKQIRSQPPLFSRCRVRSSSCRWPFCLRIRQVATPAQAIAQCRGYLGVAENIDPITEASMSVYKIGETPSRRLAHFSLKSRSVHTSGPPFRKKISSRLLQSGAHKHGNYPAHEMARRTAMKYLQEWV